MTYSLTDLLFYLLLYAFAGWTAGVGYYALKDGKFVSRGLLNLPLAMSEGITAVLLLLVLPTLEGHAVWQYGLTFLIVWIMDELALQFLRSISRRKAMSYPRSDSVTPLVNLLLRGTEALVYLCAYLLIHPFLYLFVNWLPEALKLTAVILGLVLVAGDFFGVRHILRRGPALETLKAPGSWVEKLGQRTTETVWKRLERAYPGVERRESAEYRSRYVFAQGICFDKLVWVFLVSSFLGALIEMVFCYVTGGTWMNRSSLAYGTFSVVWGLGAVLLTVVLQRMAGKPDRQVFLAGLLIGGAYEYLCSVFTEWVFGTVFWDYSRMPLNLGGRVNLLYCVFWGLLAVVWLRVLYPPMDRVIEKLPPLLGKVLTWCILAVMVADGLLTGCAMIRYTERRVDPVPSNAVEVFLDERFDDDWMENRWPNMKIPE